MMNALLDLLALMPILPAHIAKYLQEIFEVFRSVAKLKAKLNHRVHLSPPPQVKCIFH
jgi:hypothetical protein